jgi:hypothetical protein
MKNREKFPISPLELWHVVSNAWQSQQSLITVRLWVSWDVYLYSYYLRWGCQWFFLVKLPETPCWFHPMFFLFTGSMSQWHLRVWKWWNKPVKSDGYLIVYHDFAHESGRKLGCTSFSDTLSYSPIMPLSSQAELICPDQWPLQTSIMPELGTLSHFTRPRWVLGI